MRERSKKMQGMDAEGSQSSYEEGVPPTRTLILRWKEGKPVVVPQDGMPLTPNHKVAISSVLSEIDGGFSLIDLEGKSYKAIRNAEGKISEEILRKLSHTICVRSNDLDSQLVLFDLIQE